MKLFFCLLLISFQTLAFDQTLKDFNWPLTDISKKGLRKEALFSRMDRDFIDLGSSICSNRALMWAHDLKRSYNLNTAKVFLFYTKKKGKISLKTWWYHVAPVVNEKGKTWVLDAGFPGFIDRPMTIQEWLLKFADSTNCKEIHSRETELVELIFSGRTFPRRTSYGRYDCYYKVVPHTLWTPEVVAKNILGRDADGEPVRLERHEIDKEELYKACLEATTSKLGYLVGAHKKECKAYSGFRD